MVSNKKTTWKKIRKLFLKVHLWLGLGSGLLVVAICFSGTAYVFNTELTEMAAPELYKVKTVAGAHPLPTDKLLEKIKGEAGGDPTTVFIPADPGRSYRFDVKKEGDKSRNGISYFMDPYSGKILGTSLEKNSVKEFMSTMFSLHRWLLIDKIQTPLFPGITNRQFGSIITGSVTIIFTFACLTGILIWFPNKFRNWKQGLKIKTNGNKKRLVHDLHNAPAFYSLIFLLLMGITGPQWSFQWYRDSMYKTLGTYQPKKPAGMGKTSETIGPVTPKNMDVVQIASFINTADQQLAYTGDYTIRIAAGTETPVTITKNRYGFFAPAAGDKLIIDPISGKVIKTEIFKDKPLNKRIAGSIKAIHTWSVYGTFTKFLYFFACLIATTLPVTGTLIWFNKLNKKKRRKKSSIIGRQVKAPAHFKEEILTDS